MPLSINKADELFQGISDTEAQRVARLCTDRKYRKGSTIFSKGDPSNALFIVKSGKVRILSLSDKGTETIVHILKEGAIFGELLLSEEQRAFNAVAGTDALVTVLPKGSLVELLAALPAVSKNFIRLLSKRLAKVEMEFGDFGHTWSYNRLAKILLQLCEEHGKESPEGDRDPLAPDARRPGEPDRNHPGDGHDPDDPVPAHGARESPGPLPRRQQVSPQGVRPLLIPARRCRHEPECVGEIHSAYPTV